MAEDIVKWREDSWTWADMISTYRFWGLLVWFACFQLSINGTFFPSFSLFIGEFRGVASTEIGSLFMATTLFTLPGFFLGWLTIRARKKSHLFLYSFFAVIGMLLISFTENLVFLYAGAALLGAASGAVTLIIPSLLAGGRGGAEMFAVAFSILLRFRVLVLSNQVSGIFYSHLSPIVFFALLAVPIVFGTIFLLPVKSDYFFGRPPQRGFALHPERRDPFATGLLCLVPFYSVYLVYKQHGEIRTFTNSSKLLSPSAAALAVLLIPLIFPMMLVEMNSSLNRALAERPGKRPRPTWVILLWGVLFFPVSLAFLQLDLNALIEG
jgi:hypothetical protein